MPKIDGLSEKQKKFCREYIYDWNASRAARIAGYSEKTAGEIGHENLKKPEIKAEIKRLQESTAELAGISQLMLAEELKKIAFSSIAHLHESWIDRKEFEKLSPEQKACISEIQTQIRKTSVVRQGQPEQDIETEFVKIKLYDKHRAIDSLRDMFGWRAAEKLEIAGSVKSYKIVAAKSRRGTDDRSE